jgi:hypothetical protein
MKLNSIIFHTGKLSEIRAFYEEKLNFPTGTYVKENKTLDDFSDGYVNYHLNGTLICFETDENRTDVGSIVVNVENFQDFRNRIEKMDIKILGGNEHFFKVKDPEGRTIIIEPIR